MTADVLTAYEVNRQMTAKSREIDQALDEYRHNTDLWVVASSNLRKHRAIQYTKVPGKNQAEREAAMSTEIEDFIYEEERLKAAREVGKEFIRARTAQLSALQSGASALREELRLARVDNFS